MVILTIAKIFLNIAELGFLVLDHKIFKDFFANFPFFVAMATRVLHGLRQSCEWTDGQMMMSWLVRLYSLMVSAFLQAFS